MALLGPAALAMWWDMAPDVRAEFEDWHSHEHFPERMAIPGFRRGTRWTSATPGDPGIFVMYEVAAYETLTSAAYLAHLNAPTPWSTKMMPHHRNMVRCQCRVVRSRGGAVGRHALSLRFSVPPGRDDDVPAHFEPFGEALVSRPGIVGAHLLRHEAPDIPLTTEQKIRSVADLSADWVIVACGYDLAVLEEVGRAGVLDALAKSEADRGQPGGLYSLAHSATSEDTA